MAQYRGRHTTGTLRKRYHSIQLDTLQYSTYSINSMTQQKRISIAHIAESVFQTEVLVGLFLAWFILVGTGASIAIVMTKYTEHVYAEQLAQLPEDEQLPEATNVAESAQRDTGAAESAVPMAFPERLVIDTLDISLPVSNPTTRDIAALDEELKKAAVRYPDSGILGEDNANTLIFGHSSRLPLVRNQLYKAFNDIETLNVGVRIEVVATNGSVYVYHVSRVYRASAEDDSIAITTDGHMLTLLTCDSFGQRTDRWVVEARFVGIE